MSRLVSSRRRAGSLAELAEVPTRICLLTYYNTTATSPRYSCCYMYPRDHDDADARRIYKIRSAHLHPALSLQPASRPQYRVAAQYSTTVSAAAGRLHVACYTRRP